MEGTFQESVHFDFCQGGRPWGYAEKQRVRPKADSLTGAHPRRVETFVCVTCPAGGPEQSSDRPTIGRFRSRGSASLIES